MKALVLLSGGIDSTVLLAHLLHKGYECAALSFDYGQRHVRELDSAYDVAAYYGIERQVINIPHVFGASALTDGMDMPHTVATAPDATVVSGRNLVLLSIAAAVADGQGFRMVGFGGNKDDAAGYPDCRANFVRGLRDVVSEGTQSHVWLHAPFLSLTKREVVWLGRDLDAPLGMTWSCYEGLAEGPCGNCGACLLRDEVMACY